MTMCFQRLGIAIIVLALLLCTACHSEHESSSDESGTTTTAPTADSKAVGNGVRGFQSLKSKGCFHHNTITLISENTLRYSDDDATEDIVLSEQEILELNTLYDAVNAFPTDSPYSSTTWLTLTCEDQVYEFSYSFRLPVEIYDYVHTIQSLQYDKDMTATAFSLDDYTDTLRDHAVDDVCMPVNDPGYALRAAQRLWDKHLADDYEAHRQDSDYHAAEFRSRESDVFFDEASQCWLIRTEADMFDAAFALIQADGQALAVWYETYEYE